MGVDQSFYFGPYVECIYEPVPVTDTVYHCAQDMKHSVSSGDKYCRACGAGVKPKHIKTAKVTSDIDWHSVGKEISDKLYPVSSMCGDFGAPSTAYWLSNVHDGITRSTRLGKYEEDAQQITPELIQAEIGILEKTFAKEIEVLRKHYKSVRVVWGILSYCH